GDNVQRTSRRRAKLSAARQQAASPSFVCERAAIPAGVELRSMLMERAIALNAITNGRRADTDHRLAHLRQQTGVVAHEGQTKMGIGGPDEVFADRHRSHQSSSCR